MKLRLIPDTIFWIYLNTHFKLKRYFGFICILFSLISECYSQEKRDYSRVFIGVTQGMSFSQLDFGVKINQSLHSGYNGGFLFTYLSGPRIGIQLEFNYAQKGWKIMPDSTEHYSRKLNYIEIPFLTHIIVGKKKSKLIIDLGPYGSFLRSESEKTNMADTTFEYIGYNVNRNFDFGYCLGAGYQYSTKIGDFGIDARYYNSLTNIFIPSSEIHYFSSRNQVLCISIKYCIKIF